MHGVISVVRPGSVGIEWRREIGRSVMRLRTRVIGLLSTVGFVLMLGGCSASETVSIRVALNEDASASVAVTRIMMAEDEAMPAADAVQWRRQAKLVGTAGRVDDFEQITIEGIHFVLVTSQNASGDHEQHLRVEVPMGPDASWTKSMTIADPAEREAMREMLSETTQGDPPVRIGEELTIVVIAPSAISWNSLSHTASRYPRSVEKSTATITIPLAHVEREHQPLVWRIGWDQSSSE
jgi:hypothetical protein